VSWEAGRRLVLFARYQESFRPGGLAVADEVIRQFRNDDVASFEAGFRWSPSDSLALSASGAYTLWSDIQADTIGTNGFPTTSNIGDGTILSTDIRLSWRPVPALSFDAGLVVNHSEVTEPQPAFMLRTGSQLPNVADLNLRLGADYRIDLPGGDMLRLSGNVRQTGSSTLGVGEVLGIEQGNWVDVGLGIRWEHGAHIFSLNAFNLFDEAGNRFAFGSPFTLFLNPQVTPMRPRTLRLGYQIRL
jgi:outer membrane receptor protein involved in Fe transport